jgi:outer membrane protein assembly factor BamE (lipoprotein component of BamABCDE complex)
MKKIAVVLLSIVFTGCASVGNENLRAETESSVSHKIVEGKTKKSDIRAMFGSPLKTSFTDSGLEIWNYEFSKVTVDAVSFVPIVNMFGSSASGKKKELVVMFDQNNVVKRYSMSESDVTQKSGIFNQ